MFSDANAWSLGVEWGADRGVNGEHIIWGTIDCGSIVWGTDENGLDRGNIVWGTAGGGADCNGIAWGTHARGNIVWRTGERSNIVWGTAKNGPQRCNIVRGTYENRLDRGDRPTCSAHDL